MNVKRSMHARYVANLLRRIRKEDTSHFNGFQMVDLCDDGYIRANGVRIDKLEDNERREFYV